MREPDIPLPHTVLDAVADIERLDVLNALEVLPSRADPDFDRLTRLAAHILDCEFGLVTLVDKDTQFFKSCFGVDNLEQSPVDASFCAHTIAATGQDYMLVPDLSADERFAKNPYVVNAPHVRFYVGAPIIVHGQRLGSLCVLATTPRHDIKPSQIDQLIDLANVASTLFLLKDEARVRAKTSAALIREEWRHALTLEAGKVGSWVWDVPSGAVTCNETFRHMHGLPDKGEITNEQIIEAIHPRDRETMRQALAAAFSEGVDYETEARALETGRWLIMRGRVYQRDAQGTPLTLMGVSLDVTENKKTAQQTHLLLRELNHRVKNTLAMIQSVARQTIRQNPDPKGFINAFSGRLRTISEVHVLLADRDWSGVQLYEVIGGQFGPDFLINPRQARVEGEDIFLPADHALGLGLILHELTTNAGKYGAWSDGRGQVELTWSVIEGADRGIDMIWTERNGPKVSTPEDSGLGVKLIERSLAKILDSQVTLKFDPSGVSARIWLPLPPV
ncbi:HWE histidine kinase domain-containing protein [Devosia rhodophyticola]|uniref:Blue-light-activated histidine kinase n=1 Tax=Devosia rhodophyticola TaxID=3026423 RepID=A0ABY7YUX8_9HYPH|nr:HWE histidine kinase domain-containing protein [Devosia rhodophyticola]WDR05002.1 HWE histidine kinase domain-containing protein [Devosia rhodophyticola]